MDEEDEYNSDDNVSENYEESEIEDEEEDEEEEDEGEGVGVGLEEQLETITTTTTKKDQQKPDMKAKKTKKSVVLYPFFLQVKNETSDEFWKQILDNCACNKFPRGLLYDSNNNNISIKKNNKIILFSLDSNPATACDQFINICKKYKNLLSTTDSQNRNLVKDKTQETTSINYKNQFKNIKTKRGRKHFLELFVLNLCKNNTNISEEKAKHLYEQLVHFIIDNKIIPTENVIYKNYQIEHIKGITIDTNGDITHVEGQIDFIEKIETFKTLPSIWKKLAENFKL